MKEALCAGKVAIVTGGARGVGRAAASALAEAGAKIVLCDSGVDRAGHDPDPDVVARAAEELAAAGADVLGLPLALGSESSAEELVRATVERFGGVDVLFNCAGVLRDGSFGKLGEEDFRAPLEVDLMATWSVTRAAVRRMVARGQGGRVINTVSVSGMQGNLAQVNQAAAKAAIYGLTRTLAIELGRHKITVNAIAPIAKTRQTEDLPMFEHVDSLTPEHVAPLVVFLASPLSERRTGHVIASSGAQLYAFKLVQTRGKFKDGDAPWTPEEIAEHFDAIIKG